MTELWITYIKYLCSEDLIVGWSHPPDSGYGHLEPIPRFCQISLSPT